jgi:hypothetical protein
MTELNCAATGHYGFIVEADSHKLSFGDELADPAKKARYSG